MDNDRIEGIGVAKKSGQAFSLTSFFNATGKDGKRMRVLISLGGNALGIDYDSMILKVEKTAQAILPLIARGDQVLICHGNGPQVGKIKTAFDLAARSTGDAPTPLSECVAMSQGSIGYHLQNALENAMREQGIERKVVTLVTRVKVDPDDPGFSHPTKPIGAFLTKEEGEALKQQGKTVIEDSGRGYREVVPSPYPQSILESDEISDLLRLNYIVIAGGGGGIPMVGTTKLRGVDAVIDKDYVSSRLARDTDCAMMIILTSIDQVAIHFGTKNERFLDHMTIEEAKQYIEEGHFAKGSMLPKVRAALEFAESKPNRKTVIAGLEHLSLALEGKSGTRVRRKEDEEN